MTDQSERAWCAWCARVVPNNGQSATLRRDDGQVARACDVACLAALIAAQAGREPAR